MIVTLTGPTCAGKSSVEKELQKLGFGRAISHTTRPRRAGESDGDQYHFVSWEEFDRLNQEGKFVETVEFSGNKYAMSGDSLKAAQAGARHVVIVVEPHGSQQIHDWCRANNLPSFAVWVDCHPKTQAQRWLSRLLGDAVMGKEVIGTYADRLEAMLTEEASWRYDYKITAGANYHMRLDSTHRIPSILAQMVEEALALGR